MASLSSLPGISDSNGRLRNGLVGCLYVFVVMTMLGAAAPAEDTEPASSSPTGTPAATDTPAETADTKQTTPTATATQAPDTETDSGSGSSDSSDSSGSSDSSDSSGSSDSSDSSGSSDSSDSSGYQVRISYDGSWQGSMGAGGSMRSVDGSGTETFDLKKKDPAIVSANAQKQDDSSKELTVEIIKDGEVVASQSTSAEYGMAQTSKSSF